MASGTRLHRWLQPIVMEVAVMGLSGVLGCGTADRPDSPASAARESAPLARHDRPANLVSSSIKTPRPHEMSTEPTVGPKGRAGIERKQRTTLPGGRPPQHDVARLADAGIRRLTGKHLTLYTDLPTQREVDELPEVFDRAVPQWCEAVAQCVELAQLIPSGEPGGWADLLQWCADQQVALSQQRSLQLRRQWQRWQVLLPEQNPLVYVQEQLALLVAQQPTPKKRGAVLVNALKDHLDGRPLQLGSR